MTTTKDRPAAPRYRSRDLESWSGPWRRYDIVKEFVIATVAVAC
jgi:hypothetical protein